MFWGVGESGGEAVVEEEAWVMLRLGGAWLMGRLRLWDPWPGSFASDLNFVKKTIREMLFVPGIAFLRRNAVPPPTGVPGKI